jgi:hypothetical protein
MRAIRVASAALLGLTALTLTAPAAHARSVETGFRVAVLPQTVAPGGPVTLWASGCDQDVRVRSGVFDDVVIRRRQSSATAVVDRDAKPGAQYEVTFYCGTFWQTASLTVAGGGHPSHHPTAVPLPTRGAHAGEGGGAGGFDLHEVGLGAALIAGSLGAAYRIARRRAGEHDG